MSATDLTMSGAGSRSSLTGDALLLDLLLRDAHRLKIGDGRRRNEHVRFGDMAVNGGVHVARALDVDARDAGRRRQIHGSRHQRHVRAGFARRGRDGEAHLARAAIGEVAHRIEPLAGRARGDQDVEAGEQAGVRRRLEQLSASLSVGSHMRPGPVSPQA
jgi:hypothetical protein